MQAPASSGMTSSTVSSSASVAAAISPGSSESQRTPEAELVCNIIIIIFYHCRSAMICRDDRQLRWLLLILIRSHLKETVTRLPN